MTQMDADPPSYPPAALTRTSHQVSTTGSESRRPAVLVAKRVLDVLGVRLRRPIHDKPGGYLRFAALVTKPCEKYRLKDPPADHLAKMDRPKATKAGPLGEHGSHG